MHIAAPSCVPPCTCITVAVCKDGGAWRYYDSVSQKLVDTGGKSVGLPKTSIDITGLNAGSYEAKLGARNAHGWGAFGPASQKANVVAAADDDEVSFTAMRTREERDAELRKRAVDVEADDAGTGGDAGQKIVSRVKKPKGEK